MALPHGRPGFAGCCAWTLVAILCGSTGPGRPAAAAEPVAGPDLGLWLDAQDVEADGDTTVNPRDGTPIATWADKSSYRNNAIQQAERHRPDYARNVMDQGLNAIHFKASGKQYL